jgi:tRNA isopentenyl-2-thiomethyl-A-37 hydroxylase MiaE
MLEKTRADRFLDEVQAFIKEHERFRLAALASYLGYIDLNNFRRSKLPIILEHFQDCLAVFGKGTNLLFVNKCYGQEKDREKKSRGSAARD